MSLLPAMLRRLAALATVVFAGALGCALPPQPSSPSDADALDRLARAPGGAGILVYEGSVFPLDASHGAAPVFRYERRVEQHANGWRSTHLSVDSDGRPVVLHRAEHSAAYALRHFESLDAQTGESSEVSVADDGSVELTVRRDGTVVRRRRERAREPVVVGPTLFGYVLAHWDSLVAGETARIRFPDPARARTYPFVLRASTRDETRTVVSMTATSPLVRAAVPPMRIVFETASRTVVRYEGRVPPQQPTPRGLARLDARVEYEHVAAQYR